MDHAAAKNDLFIGVLSVVRGSEDLDPFLEISKGQCDTFSFNFILIGHEMFFIRNMFHRGPLISPSILLCVVQVHLPT